MAVPLSTADRKALEERADAELRSLSNYVATLIVADRDSAESASTRTALPVLALLAARPETTDVGKRRAQPWPTALAQSDCAAPGGRPLPQRRTDDERAYTEEGGSAGLGDRVRGSERRVELEIEFRLTGAGVVAVECIRLVFDPQDVRANIERDDLAERKGLVYVRQA